MKKKTILLISTVAAVLLAVSVFCVIKHNAEIKKEKQLDARFDKFMGYYYPYLKDIADAADIYKRMQISLMYDYIATRDGKYIYETVKYYDGGGCFSMREHNNLYKFLGQAELLNFSRTFEPINAGTSSREKEKTACSNILWSARALHNFDIYEDDIALYGVQKSHEILDSLNLEIQNNIRCLDAYKNSNKINLNYISESDYDLNNY